MTNHIPFGSDNDGKKAELGDIVHLQNQEQEVVKCQETGVLMLNIDADEIAPGDLAFIKKLGLTISNPDTDKPVALGVDYEENTFGHKLATFLGGAAVGALADSDDYDDVSDSDDDDSFFSGGSFGGGSSFGGFGGFGGGSFAGGGASGGF